MTAIKDFLPRVLLWEIIASRRFWLQIHSQYVQNNAGIFHLWGLSVLRTLMLVVSLLRTRSARFPFFLNTVKYKDENTAQNKYTFQ